MVFGGDLSIVFMGFINNLITGGGTTMNLPQLDGLLNGTPTKTG